ncbi:glycerophosphodiester phosphodiesterase [Paenibacillus thiaminolyticus]|uniref:glycerophosphodiester phosphodiesterase n=1 Tax=Paenibacillus thiaminolyticus TaxID=49283 RepID=UPI002542F54D|nr:glycerophosphodiester phosphodiesterase [Paenibacillus thiaminolyticus]WII39740.1 glycerophosphodiester phosphodiesterase [Paenibacillus thiaminolyticus]
MIRKFPMVGAHTGGGAAPDNTLESFWEGVQSGADIVEIDLRAAADGTAVLLHDASPLLRQYTYEQLNRVENRIQLSPVYEHRDIVKLDHILDIAKQQSIKLNLDIKNEETVAPAMECVLRHGMENQVFVTGCSTGIAGNYKGIRVVYNTPDELSEADIADYGAFAQRICDEALQYGACGLNMDYRTCRTELVEAAHERQLAVWVYTVNAADELKRYIGMGVDAITTRRPLALLELKPTAGDNGTESPSPAHM